MRVRDLTTSYYGIMHNIDEGGVSENRKKAESQAHGPVLLVDEDEGSSLQSGVNRLSRENRKISGCLPNPDGFALSNKN
jgi:hypothetical protein